MGVCVCVCVSEMLGDDAGGILDGKMVLLCQPIGFQPMIEG